MHFLVSFLGLLWIGGVLVFRRRIEFVRHRGSLYVDIPTLTQAGSSKQLELTSSPTLELQGISERAARWLKSTMAESSRRRQRQDKRSPDRVSFWFWWSAWCWQ